MLSPEKLELLVELSGESADAGTRFGFLNAFALFDHEARQRAYDKLRDQLVREGEDVPEWASAEMARVNRRWFEAEALANTGLPTGGGMTMAVTAEKTKPEVKANTVPAVERFMVLNDKGGIGKSLLIQGLSLELAAAGIDHRVIEAETDPRLRRVLGESRVIYHSLSEESFHAIRRNPDLAAEYWDNVVEDFMSGVRLLDMGANASKLFWNWFDSGVGSLVLGKGEKLAALVVTTAEHESLHLASQAVARVAPRIAGGAGVPGDEHPSRDAAGGSPVMDNLCRAAGERAAEVVRITVPRCVAPAWPTMMNTGKPLSEIAVMKPHDLVPYGFKLGAAARSIHDVVEWLDEFRPEMRRILAAGGIVRDAA